VKTTFKPLVITGTLAIALVLSATATTQSSFAVTTLNNCAKITKISSTNKATLTTKIAAMNADFATRLTAISDRHAAIDQKLADARSKTAAAFDTKIQALSAKEGITDAQQKAIQKYQTDMKAAEAIRIAAVDAARATYRADLTENVTAHQSALSAAATSYQTALATAAASAVTNCRDSTAVETLKSDIKIARAAFRAARTDAKITTEIKDLMATRNTEIKTANTAFATSATAYSTVLSTALEGTSSDSAS